MLTFLCPNLRSRRQKSRLSSLLYHTRRSEFVYLWLLCRCPPAQSPNQASHSCRIYHSPFCLSLALSTPFILPLDSLLLFRNPILRDWIFEMKKLLSKFRHSTRLSTPSTPDPALSATTAQVGPHQTIPQSERSVSVSVLEDSQEKLTHNNANPNAPLENLQPEVRRHLLSMLELEGLKALVSASPIYYHQYLLDHRHLLGKCLESTLRTVTVDVCAVYQSGSVEFSEARTNERVTQFLRSYQDRRSRSQHSILDDTFTIDDVIRMVAFHSSIIKPLERHYTSWAFDNLSKEGGDPRSHESLSATEEKRLMRALYRFQLCCNLFGVGRHGSYQQPKLGFDSVDILKIFICIFEPWEVEEIACVYTFAKQKYNQIFDDIAWDVNEKNPKFSAQRPPTPEGAFDLDNSC